MNITALENWQSWSHPQASLAPELVPFPALPLLLPSPTPTPPGPSLLPSASSVFSTYPLCLQSLASTHLFQDACPIHTGSLGLARSGRLDADRFNSLPLPVSPPGPAGPAEISQGTTPVLILPNASPATQVNRWAQWPSERLILAWNTWGGLIYSSRLSSVEFPPRQGLETK